MPDKKDSPDTTATTSAAAAPAKAKPARKPKSRPLPPYNVVLLNDDDHTFEYVMEMLKSLFAHPHEMGMQLAQRVHREGRAVVYTTHKEKAELKRDQIHAFGTDQRVACCAGSMSALIEPAQAE
ncbi:MAG TPA: ATP-dependent Clp protease adaptor ClpS [Tepidisphaeraceae bacterium]|nr:ATP-dependent Clp protease adaptor ClpS [Tepidisphaeraceae bacterium]